MKMPVFHDADPKIRTAREIAFKYLRGIKLKDHALGNIQTSTRDLGTTLEQELVPDDPDPDMDALFEQMQRGKDIVATQYDPEKAVADRQEDEAAERKAAQGEAFKQVMKSLSMLADPKITALTDIELEGIQAVLAMAPMLLSGRMMPDASVQEVDAAQALNHTDEVARKINATRYRGAKNPESMAECTPDDIMHTRFLLQYVHERARTLELGLGDLLNAVTDINATLNGTRRSL